MTDYPYIYAWGNNALRAKWKGKRCKVLVRGKRNSCLIEFEDGLHVNTSRNALRKAKP